MKDYLKATQGVEEEVTITLSRGDCDTLFRVLTQLGHGRISSFETPCKFCGKRIKMYSNDSGANWKPVGRKSGKPHRCEEGKAAYKRKLEEMED